MSWDGMLPQSSCKGCGKLLNADGGHPAETYAGTATGLCDACMYKAPYVAETYADGGKLVSHPPSTPSYRRDRVFYSWYEDCQVCHMGAIAVSRSYQEGGPYTAYCRECSRRQWRFQETERDRKLTENGPLQRLLLRYRSEQVEQQKIMKKHLSKNWVQTDRELAGIRVGDYDGLITKLEDAIVMDRAGVFLANLETTLANLKAKELALAFRVDVRLPWLEQVIESVRAAMNEEE